MTSLRRTAAALCASMLPLFLTISLAKAQDTASGQICRTEGEGYRTAWWQCHDGTESGSQGGDTSCKSSETWNRYAQQACEGKCNPQTKKCGVNSFSVSTECAGETMCKPANSSSCPGERELNAAMTRCKESGHSYVGDTDANGCRMVKCVEKIVPGTRDQTSCTNKAEILRKMRSCEEGGGKAILKRENNCPVFADCETRPKEEETATTVSCKKMIVGNCATYSCDDGASWSNCRQTDKPKPTVKPGSARPSAHCSEIERKVRELSELVKKDSTNEELMKRGREFRLQWNECRKAKGAAQ